MNRRVDQIMRTSQALEDNRWIEIIRRNLPRALARPWLPIFKVGLLVTPLVFIFVLVLVKLKSQPLYRFLIREDGPIEYMTALVYFIACMIAFSLGMRLYRQRQLLYGVIYVVLSVGFFFIGMEEISWGQRIFRVSTPEFFKEYNYQKELNLHNFASRYPLHGAYIIIGGCGAFAFLIIPKWIFKRFKIQKDLIVPYWFLSTYFFPVFLIYMYYDYLSGPLVSQFGEHFAWGNIRDGHRYFIVGKDQEPMEFILSLGFLLFVTINWCRLRLGRFPARSSA